jgi:hypothetical protein
MNIWNFVIFTMEMGMRGIDTLTYTVTATCSVHLPVDDRVRLVTAEAGEDAGRVTRDSVRDYT